MSVTTCEGVVAPAASPVLSLRLSALERMCAGLQTDPLPPRQVARDPTVPHAPVRYPHLSEEQKRQALANALRYFPPSCHEELAADFLQELEEFGHIYMYRFRPTDVPMRAYPLEQYPGNSVQARTVMFMLMNNLDPAVAQFPHELITYGGNGSVFSNWAQFRIAVHLLSKMTDHQTLVLYSGHPLGLFPSHPDAPRVVFSNGLMVPTFSTPEMYDRLYALGVSQYGQMTAGSACYVGPQGIIGGTSLVLLEAGRKYLQHLDGSVKGKVYVSSGLGGMSGAQPKAAVITGAIGVIAEVDRSALMKRFRQGWVQEVIEEDLDALIVRIRRALAEKISVSIGFLGNIVDVWERLVQEHKVSGELLVHLGSDQTSLHNPFNGGYYPVDLSFEDAQMMMRQDPDRFMSRVEESLRRQVAAINYLSERGMRFWDYGNAFLLQASRAGADVMDPEDPSHARFRYPSYVQDIMGDVFSLGYGPFRWICTSGDASDLDATDKIAEQVLRELLAAEQDPRNRQMYLDTIDWICRAKANQMVVGSQARILYTNCRGRVLIAKAINKAVGGGQLLGPVALSRDHHDVSGADSPYRETSNIADGSEWTADMSFHTVVGNAMRGATWVALHNGGGVGWGLAQNCGFGLVLDGTEDADRRASAMLLWDVCNGVARRAWSGNSNAYDTIREAMDGVPGMEVTLPHAARSEVLDRLFSRQP